MLCQCSSLRYAASPELLTHGPFDLYVYRPPGTAQHLALFLSGDGGWGEGLGATAERLAAGATLVAGIDVRHLLASYRLDAAPCISPGADLAELSHYLREHYHLGPAAPVLIGHSAGATLAYVALAQAAAGTFQGALTLSFCADLDLTKPLCPALADVPLPGGVRLLPAASLPAPWIALHGLEDGECPAAAARSFASAVRGARFIALPGVTHNYRERSDLDRRLWWPQFDAAYRELAGPPAAPSGAP